MFELNQFRIQVAETIYKRQKSRGKAKRGGGDDKKSLGGRRKIFCGLV